ncbi:hypothetical protein [Nocardiopsis quinghaiensis]|uniref:hypothetical protein n=1 Tax=Nocardiopsis quinghaiensis TaxID=464995 RepID=UPI00123A6981|nr:hypothetical protein [Nocardiopsis quinghaiensis]
MFNTARTSARTMLVAAGTAGFVALGAGISGADTLGGVTDGLPLNDLGGQVPASLTEGVSTPLGELVRVEPGQLSAQPDVRRQSAPGQPFGGVVGDTVSTDAPIGTGEDNAADVGPLDLNTAADGLPLAQSADRAPSDPLSGLLGGTDVLSGLGLGGGTLPLSHAAPPSASPVSSDPLSGLLGGTDVLSGLGLGGGTLPLSHTESPVPLSDSTEEVDAAVDQLGSAVERGTHEVGGDLNGLDATLPTPGEPLPLSAAMDGPVAPVNGENTDLTGGAGDIVSELVLSDDVVPMSAGSSALPQLIGDAPVGPLPVPEVADATGLVADTARTTQLAPGGDSLGNDLVGVEGMPELGRPDVDTGALDDTLSGGLV